MSAIGCLVAGFFMGMFFTIMMVYIIAGYGGGGSIDDH